MKHLKFRYLSAKNFLCFGSKGIELDLDSLGNIVVVKGKNWDDINPVTGQPGSNGSGKTTIYNILVFTLFGKTIKKLKNQGLIFNKSSKGQLRTEVRWDDYRVVRCLEPRSLSFDRWDGEKWVDESAGAGAPETQKKIEAAIGLNLRSFINIIVFDYNSISFLDCELATKREIVENLLSLDKYRLYNKMAKDLKKDCEKRVKELSDEYMQLNLQLDATKKRLSAIDEQEVEWKSGKKASLTSLLQKIKELGLSLQTSDDGKAISAYNDAQESIGKLLEEIPQHEANQASDVEIVVQLKAKLGLVENKIMTLKNDIALLEQRKFKVIDEIKALASEIVKMKNSEPGVRCKSCLMEADPASFASLISENQDKINKLQADVDDIISPASKAKMEEFSKYAPMLELVSKKIKLAEASAASHSSLAQKARSAIFDLQKIKKPEASSDVLLVEQRIAGLKSQAKDLHSELNGPSPFDKIRTTAKQDIENKQAEYETKKSQIHEAERLLPYYEYWVTAFGDSGIRKYVIDGIIEPLNERISFWLNYLIYGNISLKFDNELEETICRLPINDDDPFVYDQLSGGEQRRLNLSIPLSFAHCMELSSGSSPSVVFLDEVAVNIDENGIEGIYHMIRELSIDKQVFVTDHNPLLLDLLQGQNAINLERRNRITNLAS